MSAQMIQERIRWQISVQHICCWKFQCSNTFLNVWADRTLREQLGPFISLPKWELNGVQRGPEPTQGYEASSQHSVPCAGLFAQPLGCMLVYDRSIEQLGTLSFLKKKKKIPGKSLKANPWTEHNTKSTKPCFKNVCCWIRGSLRGPLSPSLFSNVRDKRIKKCPFTPTLLFPESPAFISPWIDPRWLMSPRSDE